ncbi:MAG: hypothetical protein WD073_03370 [Xanthobacteraceae bacterium]
MLRTTVLAIAATAALGVAALVPTSADATDHRDGWRHRDHHSWNGRAHGPYFSFRFYGPRAYAYYPRCRTVQRWVHTRHGWRLRRVEVCR